MFSGTEFNVDRKQGLSGYCDYLLSRSPALISVEAPVAVLVEAKKEDLNAGTPQCIAEMIAAQVFNEKRRQPISPIFGCVSSGTAWRFLQLENKVVTVDLVEVYIDDVARLLGRLIFMATGEIPPASVVS